MKKTSTYYFAVFAIMNLFLGFIFQKFNVIILGIFGDLFEAGALPAGTMLLLSVPWWPYACAALLFGGILVSAFTGIHSSTLCHVLVAILALEVMILFYAVFAYTMPFIHITSPLR